MSTTNTENTSQISEKENEKVPDCYPASHLASLPFTRSDLHILAVDDDTMLLKSVTKALADLGYKVTTANNGAEGLEFLKTSGGQIDLILSDVMMPVMNGPQFLAAARSDPSFAEIPIVMMSSNDQYEIVFDCLSKGADDYMIKPLSPQVLKNIYANVWIKRKQNAAAAKIQHQIVESSVITSKIESMKKNFSASVQTPVKDAIIALQKILENGGILPEAMTSVSDILSRLNSLNEEGVGVGSVSVSGLKPQIPAKMQDFFASQFGFGGQHNPSLSTSPTSATVSSFNRIVTPIAVTALKKRAAPAVDIPHLQSLNLGEKVLFSFDFNTWNVSENMLMNLAFDILSEMGVKETLGAKLGELEHFLKRAMQGHKPNPFHNFRRACDSLQFVAVLLRKVSNCSFTSSSNSSNSSNLNDTSKSNISSNSENCSGKEAKFTAHEQLGCLFAALLHDVDHPGTNNLFQIKTSSQTALIYNDRKVLENNSASCGAKIVQDCFSFSINDEQLVIARQTFLNCVLHTDYSKCQKFIGQILAHDEIDWQNKEQRQMGLALIVLMGDMAFAVRPWEVAGYWYGMMRDEQLQQGDMERRLGLPVAPLMDRRQPRPHAVVTKWHFKSLVMMVFQAGAKVFPEVEKEILTALQRNLQIIEEMEIVEQQHD